jgi:hypothetical protein
MGMGIGNGGMTTERKSPQVPPTTAAAGMMAEGLGNWREKETNGTLKGRGKEE